MGAAGRVFKWVMLCWLVGFIPGFFGPIVFAPGANQGPLLGIFVTGPIGAMVGLGLGLWREWRRTPDSGSSMRATAAPDFPSATELLRHPLARVIAALIALILLVQGVTGLRQGVGRGAAAAVIIAVIMGYFAATARFPDWARRR